MKEVFPSELILRRMMDMCLLLVRLEKQAPTPFLKVLLVVMMSLHLA